VASVTGIFLVDTDRSMCPGVNSASKRNECQEYILGGKGGRCVGLTILPPSCVVMISWSLNILEPSGPVQACNVIALPFPKHHKFQTKKPPQALRHDSVTLKVSIKAFASCATTFTLPIIKPKRRLKSGQILKMWQAHRFTLETAQAEGPNL